MKFSKIAMSILLIVTLAAPVMASSNWVEDFLRRYEPTNRATVASPSTSSLSQLLQTGIVPVTLNDVVNMMLEHNLDIRSNRLAPRSSYFQSLVFYRALLPSIRFAGTITRNTSSSNTQLNGAQVLSQLRGDYMVNFSQLLPTGTSLAVDLNMNRQSSNSLLNTFNPSYTSRVTYTVGQHLLRDRGRTVNTHQILIGQNNEKISETQFEIQITNLLVQAQKAYWDLVFAGEDLNVKQRSLDLAQRTLDENKMKVEIGTLAPIDVVQTQSDVAARREQLVLSTYNVTQSEDQIKKLTSSDKDPAMFLVKLRAQESPTKPESVQIPTLEEAVKIALESRPEMRQSLLDLENKDLDIHYMKNQKLPSFDVTATYNQNGTGGTQTVRGQGFLSTQILNVIPGGIGKTFGQLFSYDYTGYSLGFSFVLPLSNKAQQADYDRALNEKRLSESRINVTAQAIALEVRNALTQAEMNRARIETAQITRELADQKLEAEQTKFNLGTSTLRFVLEEQRNVAQAQTNEVQTIVNFTKSLVDLDKAMGLTLRKNNVEIDKTLNPVAGINVIRKTETAAR
jgi:outer membrane protein TolC